MNVVVPAVSEAVDEVEVTRETTATAPDGIPVVYADFSCPLCDRAAARVAVLGAAGHVVDWRAVETHPSLPRSGRPRTEQERAAATEQLGALAEILVPDEAASPNVPVLLPKTESAVSAHAEAYHTPVEHEVRRILLDLYWREGVNIGTPDAIRDALTGPMLRSGSSCEPIRSYGYAVSIAGGPMSAEGQDRIDTWRAEWLELGLPELPALVVDGRVITGLDAVRTLGDWIVERDVPVNPELPDPRRFPEPDDGYVSKTFVSMTGGGYRTEMWGNQSA